MTTPASRWDGTVVLGEDVRPDLLGRGGEGARGAELSERQLDAA